MSISNITSGVTAKAVIARHRMLKKAPQKWLKQGIQELGIGSQHINPLLDGVNTRKIARLRLALVSGWDKWNPLFSPRGNQIITQGIHTPEQAKLAHKMGTCADTAGNHRFDHFTDIKSILEVAKETNLANLTKGMINKTEFSGGSIAHIIRLLKNSPVSKIEQVAEMVNDTGSNKLSRYSIEAIRKKVYQKVS